MVSLALIKQLGSRRVRFVRKMIKLTTCVYYFTPDEIFISL